MNAASIFGRTLPNFVADHHGPLNGELSLARSLDVQATEACKCTVLIPSGLISAGLIFAMFGATSVAGVATFGVFYGFFSGGSELIDVGPFNVLYITFLVISGITCCACGRILCDEP